MIGLGSRRMSVLAVSLILLMICATAVARPARASNPDFTLSASPSSVVMLAGYWSDTVLTLSSVDGLQGTVQFSLSFNTNIPGIAAGFNTGMTLNPDDHVNTDVMLTAGGTPGDYNYTITATVGAVSHNITLPVRIVPVSGPDFITRLWGSYAILQDWPATIQEELTSIDGFQGDVGLTASVSPSLLDGPIVTLQPSNIHLTSSNAVFTVSFSSNRETPPGNYIVTVTAVSGTQVHTSQALLMVGEYRPPTERQPGTNSTITSSSSTVLSSVRTVYGDILTSVFSGIRSLWLLAALAGIGVAVALIVVKRRPG